MKFPHDFEFWFSLGGTTTPPRSALCIVPKLKKVLHNCHSFVYTLCKGSDNVSDKKRLSVTIPEELISKVDKYAKEMGVTKSVYLALLIRKDIEKKEKNI